MNGALLRRAGPDDTAAIAELERQAQAHPWSADQLRAELSRPAPDEVLVLESPGGIVAYCACRLALDELEVMNLAVREDARRRGFARFLLAKALARGRRAGARRALLEVRAGNEAARALYSQSGFVPLGRRKEYYREPVEDALVLAREPLPESDAGGAPGRS